MAGAGRHRLSGDEIPEVLDAVGRYAVGSRWRLRHVHRGSVARRWPEWSMVEIVAIEGPQWPGLAPDPADMRFLVRLDAGEEVIAVWCEELE